MSKPLKNEFSDNDANAGEPPASRETLIAQAATRPNLLAAHTIRRFNHMLGDISLMELTNELSTQIIRVLQGDLGRAEEALAAQAIVLDTLFHTLAIKALQAPGADQQALILKLALQSQRQCCQTYQALSSIKKPPAVTVVSQTNIGQTVQVNNGAIGNNPQTILENELLETPHGERLDSGAQIAAIATHQDMATLAELNRPQD
jgi:hypothetical protein